MADTKETTVEYWTRKIEAARKEREEFYKQGKRSRAAYRLEQEPGKPKQLFPIWWSTIQVLRSAVFARLPSPDVRARYAQPGGTDPTTKLLTQAIERSISYILDTEDVYEHAQRAVDEYLVSGLGVAKVEYNATVADEPIRNDATGEEVAVAPTIQKQTVRIEYYPSDRLIWECTKDWEDVDWVAFVHYLTRAEIKQRYGVTLKDAPEDKEYEKRKDRPSGVQVWEVWDKRDRSVTVIAEGEEDALDAWKDKLGLKQFFPIAQPMMTNVAPDVLTPKPDYEFVADLCDQVQIKTARIQNLSKQVKDVGLYDASFAELASLMEATDGTRIPVKNLLERLSKSDGRATFDAVVAVQDNSGKVATIQTLMQAREQDKAQIFETTGISDIVRGASQAEETATAQQIKGQWANVRLGPKQKTIAYWFRDTYRLIAEVIAEHFSAEQIYLMTGLQLAPEHMAALQSDLGRNLLIDMETDATTAQDDQANRKDALEMLQTLTGYAQNFAPAVAQGAIPADFAKEALLLVARQYRAGRQFEDTIHQFTDSQSQLTNLGQKTQQAMQQAEQAGQQIKALEVQLQKAQAELQANGQQEQARKDFDTKSQATLREAQTAKTWAEAQAVGVTNPADPIKAEADLIRARSEANAAQLIERKAAAEAEVATAAAVTALSPPKPKVKRTVLQYDDAGNPTGAVTVEAPE